MVTNNVYRVTLWGDENFLELESGDGCKQLGEYTKSSELYTLKELVLWIRQGKQKEETANSAGRQLEW